MKGRDIIFGIIVVILWYLSLFYLVAPHDVHNMLFGGFGMTHQQHHLLGVLLFVVSLLIIMIWAVTGTSETSATSKVPAATTVPS